MSKISLEPNSSGAGTFSIVSPDSNINRTLNLPDESGSVLTDFSDIEPQVKTATNASGDAPIYACRAWVNFDGTDTVSIRASGNVSSITDNGTGDYTVNFSTAMPDTNWSSQCDSNSENLGLHTIFRATNNSARTKSTTQCHVQGKRYRHAVDSRNLPIDLDEVMVAVFR